MANDDTNGNTPFKLFVSYAHADQAIWGTLRGYLKPLVAKRLVEVWWDAAIVPGRAWRQEINDALEAADAVLVLLSRDYIESEECQRETERALELKDSFGILIVPIWMDDVSGDTAWRQALQALHDLQGITWNDGKGLSGAPSWQEAGKHVAQKLRDTLGEFRRDRAGALPILKQLADDMLAQAEVLRKAEKYIWLDPLSAAGESTKWNDAFLGTTDKGQLQKHLLQGGSGAGKTTLLLHIARELLTTTSVDGVVPFYLHLSDLGRSRPDAFVLDRLRQANPDLSVRRAELAVSKAVEVGKVLFLLDGYDQVSAWTPSDMTGIRVVATRPLPDSEAARWRDSGWEIWNMEPVSLEKAQEYLGRDIWGTEEIRRLRREKGKHQLLRVPLFLGMLRELLADGSTGITTRGEILEHYWVWSTEQEDRARRQAGRDEVAEGEWVTLRQAVIDVSWQIALDGHIEEFPSEFPRQVVDAAKLLGRMDLERFDVIRVTRDQGRFRHQAFHAYFSAQAVAHMEEGSVAAGICAPLADGLPELVWAGGELDSQTSFWLEVMDYLPGALKRKLGKSAALTQLTTRIGGLIRTLAGHGLFLLAWRLSETAVEELGEPAGALGWRAVLWQLLRYRRDAERHHPKGGKGWHYDPLPDAIAAMDDFSKADHGKLRAGLAQYFGHVPRPGMHLLGPYELLCAYMDWDGSVNGDATLDRWRAGFLLGENAVCRMTDASKKYVEDGMSYAGGRRRKASVAAQDTRMPQPDDERFGAWLDGHFDRERDPATVGKALDHFRENRWDREFNPYGEDFASWLGQAVVGDLLTGNDVPADVTLRVFDAGWNWGLDKPIEERIDDVQALLLPLFGKDVGNQLLAMTCFSRLAKLREERSELSLLDPFREPLWHLFQDCIGKGDADMAYSAVQELSRLELDRDRLVAVQTQVERHLAQEVRWHDVYIGDHQEQFNRERMGLAPGKAPSYERKRWYYCYAMPMLLENGTDVDALLNEYAPHATLFHEKAAVDWARNAVACMKAIVTRT